jgi:hypothetical protein
VKGEGGEAGESQSFPFYRRRASGGDVIWRGSNRRGGDVEDDQSSGSVIDAKTSGRTGQMGIILSL